MIQERIIKLSSESIQAIPATYVNSKQRRALEVCADEFYWVTAQLIAVSRLSHPLNTTTTCQAQGAKVPIKVLLTAEPHHSLPLVFDLNDEKTLQRPSRSSFSFK
jgi:hypothetical protein